MCPDDFSLRALGGTLAAVIVAITLLSGCASAPPQIEGSFIGLEAQELRLLREERKIHVVVYAPPPFDINTGATSYVTGGVYGISHRYGQKKQAVDLQKESNLNDPAVTVRDRFLSNWRNTFPVTDVISYELTLPGEDEGLNTLRTTFTKGTILDFKTVLWQIRLDLSVGAGHYRVDYQARGRLVRLDDEKVFWQGWCNFTSQSAPHRSELVADKGAALKRMFEEAAGSCAQELWVLLIGSKE